MFKMLKGASVFLLPLLFTGIFLSACDDSGLETPTTQNNPNVKSFDSVGVEEDVSAGSLSGINLLDGVNTARDYYLRDCSLRDSGSSGFNFFLRSGILLNKLDAGYDCRFFQVAPDYTIAEFDTMSAVYTNIGSAFDTLDFTEDNTEFWGYFNASLSSRPVYCFYLQGKKAAGLNNNTRVFGIIQPIEANDLTPGVPGGYTMSFKIRINTNGENDFRKTITVGN